MNHTSKLNVPLWMARKDFSEYLRDGRLYWAGGLVLILLLTALAVGWQNQRAISGERVVAQKLDYSDWVSQNTRHPHVKSIGKLRLHFIFLLIIFLLVQLT